MNKVTLISRIHIYYSLNSLNTFVIIIHEINTCFIFLTYLLQHSVLVTVIPSVLEETDMRMVNFRGEQVEPHDWSES